MIVIAHRGASDIAPENTLAAFREAVRVGADLVEMDLRLTRDREVVVFHDRDLDRTTDGTGPLAEKTLAELKNLDASARFAPEFKGERIPTLAEALAVLSAGRTGVCLELKIDRGREDARPELVSRTLEILKEISFPNRLLLASFDLAAVRLVRTIGPELETGLIFREETVWTRPAAELTGVDLLSARWNIVTSSRVAVARGDGKEVWAWTVDRPDELARVCAAGVDGVASNNPAWLKKELERSG